MNKLGLMLGVTLICCVESVRASSLQTGSELPAVEVTERGELLIDERDDMYFRPWTSTAHCGQPQVLLHVAARLSVKDMNRPFTDALQERFQGKGYQFTTIVNLDDALWGTRGLVESQLKNNKKEHGATVFVADRKGLTRARWGLAKKSNAIILLDAACSVLFVREGSMNGSDIDRALELLQAAIGPGMSP